MPYQTGTLTTENVDQVAVLLRRLLEGKTFIIFDGRRLEESLVLSEIGEIPGAPPVRVWHGRLSVSVNITTNHGMWKIRVDPDQPEPTFITDDVSFVVYHHSEAGKTLRWMFALEI